MTVINYPTAAIRPNILLKGIFLNGHEHTFDHLTMAVLGRFRIEVETDKGEHGWRIISAPTKEQAVSIHSNDDIQAFIDQFCFNVPANWKHKITGLDDINMFLCNYAPRDEDGRLVNTHAKDTHEYYEWITGWPKEITGKPNPLVRAAALNGSVAHR
jgi:hypothetical protein